MKDRILQDKQKVALNNDVLMPLLGIGVYQINEDEDLENTIHKALEEGYRNIDTAMIYENEVGVGKAIKSSGVPREEIFITTKVWNADHGFDSTLKAFELSRRKINVDVIDLYLIHWPGKDKFIETWRALEKLYREGFVRAIGVCNFQIHHLQTLISASEIVPAVNQVECHPLLSQQELRQWCIEQGIQMMAYSPMMRGRLRNWPLFEELSKTYGKTMAQIVLRWHIQNGVAVIPKSVTPSRIRENAQIFNFELSTKDMDRISQLNLDLRIGLDPDQFLF
ncbi:aldo/keto reductase [Paenibacillus xylanexedens]|uniref:aldo/keto reductase n=1 Tax=Paenibacillus xylanexedens TaxID=528191 RepID=UPI0011A176C6|nr:aldo/keto reductase [Paenibacillus xylanexedens]